MRDLHRRQRAKRVVYSIPVLILLGALLIFVTLEAFEAMVVQRDSVRRLVEGEEKMLDLSKREEELKEDIARLGTEEGVRAEIREKFNVVEEGEQVVLILDPKPSLENKEKKEIWWKRVWSAILGK